jgi:GTP-binding protein
MLLKGHAPQTRFVTQKALSLGLKPIVVINKVDKENCRPPKWKSMSLTLLQPRSTEDQLNFPDDLRIRQARLDEYRRAKSPPMISVLCSMPSFKYIPEARFRKERVQMQITSLDYSSYVGDIAIGRVTSARNPCGMQVT